MIWQLKIKVHHRKCYYKQSEKYFRFQRPLLCNEPWNIWKTFSERFVVIIKILRYKTFYKFDIFNTRVLISKGCSVIVSWTSSVPVKTFPAKFVSLYQLNVQPRPLNISFGETSTGTPRSSMWKLNDDIYSVSTKKDLLPGCCKR